MNKINLDLKNYSKDQSVWKYFDLTGFINLLLNERLVFRRFDKFADKLEGTMPESSQLDYQKFLERILPPEEALQRMITQSECVNRFKYWAYANSWSISDNENYALWKIYLDNNKCGIAIKSTIEELSKSIEYDSSQIKNDEQIYIREVNYGDLKYGEMNQINVFTNKYIQYAYETELRLFFKNQRDFQNKQIDIVEGYNENEFKLIKIDLPAIAHEVYISPFADDWIRSTIQDLVRSKFEYLNLKFATSKIRV
jgi:hypothetical protein